MKLKFIVKFKMHIYMAVILLARFHRPSSSGFNRKTTAGLLGYNLTIFAIKISVLP